MEAELAGRAHVIRLNVADEAGRQLAGRYGLTAVPTFIVFPGGSEPSIRQVGMPQAESLYAALFGGG